ncbi:MAG: polyphenol oxidase family protein [Eggerthellaceae bacterium]|jgi:YfiH family protein|nr:polyphenol oxidase family protein [Eggerthellaceae bacterium]
MIEQLHTSSSKDVLPRPRLVRGRFAYSSADGTSSNDSAMPLVTDDRLFDQCGIRVAFTEREGGVSKGCYSSLDLATHVNDDPGAVEENRRRLCSALAVDNDPLVVPRQVHGNHVVTFTSDHGIAFDEALNEAHEGADALVVSAPHVAAMLCFADCTPVILVAPGGMFAVVHAGWRGVVAHVVVNALNVLCRAASCSALSCNAYIGAHIRSECFEVGSEVVDRFRAEFGDAGIRDARHVEMGDALRADLMRHGVDNARIVELESCTHCSNDRFFSYRAQHGVCGRHAAIAIRSN